MIVVRKLNETSRQIESLTLTARSPEDCELLTALYGDYTREGRIEVILRNNRSLSSAISERRRSPRVASRLPVVLMWEQDGAQHEEETFTLNLSRFGCAIHTETFFPPKTAVRLRYQGRILEGVTAYSLSDHSRRLVEVGIDFGRDASFFWAIPFQKK